MQPLLDIRTTHNRRYTYSLDTTGSSEQPGNVALGSIEACLAHAGAAMGGYAQRVQVSFEGTRLGSFLALRLTRQPHDVADEMMRGMMSAYAASVA